eukprot:9301877-Pyramimonas_sp.AAC.1
MNDALATLGTLSYNIGDTLEGLWVLSGSSWALLELFRASLGGQGSLPLADPVGGIVVFVRGRSRAVHPRSASSRL